MIWIEWDAVSLAIKHSDAIYVFENRPTTLSRGRIV